MRVLDVRCRTVTVTRFLDPGVAPCELTTAVVALATDAIRDGQQVVGYGFSSFGRVGGAAADAGDLSRRLLQAHDEDLSDPEGSGLSPLRAREFVLRHRLPEALPPPAAVLGTLDMALWDAASKIAGLPLFRFLGARLGQSPRSTVPVYASGGYRYPRDDHARLAEEVRRFLDAGHTHVKIKIGDCPLAEDLERVETVLALLPRPDRLAVDGMNRYAEGRVAAVAKALEPYGLRWIEDVCDPSDMESLSRLAAASVTPLGAGEAIRSLDDARTVLRQGGLRPDRDVLLIDPVHCGGLPEYLAIVAAAEDLGWPRRAFFPHGGHLFSLHVAAALGLGGCESNPASFQPFGGLAEGAGLRKGMAAPPEAPGIGFETKPTLVALFESVRRGGPFPCPST